jgi:DNA-binding NarL/FixJ family response regulator
MKVIIADDSVLILERLQKMLSNYKQVEIVGLLKNGIEALDALSIQQPDLAIIDMEMPGLNGMEILKEIRKSDKNLKFIILTFYSTEIYRKMAIQLGADYFFSKGDDFEKVSLVVEEMLLKHNSMS